MSNKEETISTFGPYEDLVIHAAVKISKKIKTVTMEGKGPEESVETEESMEQ